MFDGSASRHDKEMALPYASFYDAQVDEILGLDGVNESLLHAVLVGRT